MMTTRGGVVALKLPSLPFLGHQGSSSTRRVVVPNSASASASASPPPLSCRNSSNLLLLRASSIALAFVSLGHLTRPDSPILHKEVNGSKLVYLDNTATSQKPNSVIKTLQNYCESYNSNVHRGIHYLSAKATDEYELAKKKVTAFINASDSRGIVFMRNATEAIDLVAYSWGLSNLKPRDEPLFFL